MAAVTAWQAVRRTLRLRAPRRVRLWKLAGQEAVQLGADLQNAGARWQNGCGRKASERGAMCLRHPTAAPPGRRAAPHRRQVAVLGAAHRAGRGGVRAHGPVEAPEAGEARGAEKRVRNKELHQQELSGALHQWRAASPVHMAAGVDSGLEEQIQAGGAPPLARVQHGRRCGSSWREVRHRRLPVGCAVHGSMAPNYLAVHGSMALKLLLVEPSQVEGWALKGGACSHWLAIGAQAAAAAARQGCCAAEGVMATRHWCTPLDAWQPARRSAGDAELWRGGGPGVLRALPEYCPARIGPYR